MRRSKQSSELVEPAPPALVALFGDVEVEVRGRAVHLTPTEQLLLAVLILNGKTPSERLQELFWPPPTYTLGGDAAENLASLRRALRMKLGGRLKPFDDPVALEEGGLEVDVRQFEVALKLGTPDGFDAAIRLYRGKLLAALPGSAYKTKDGIEREELRELASEWRNEREDAWQEALDEQASRLEAQGGLEQALRYRRLAFASHPIYYGAAPKLMRLLRKLGNEPELTEVHRRATKHYEAAGLAVAVPLGEFLADADEPPGRSPEGLGPRAAPPQRSVGRGDLPHRIGKTVGREAEAEAITARIEGARLVTILGEPGVGKTHLGQFVGSQLQRRYGEELYYFELAPLHFGQELWEIAVQATAGLPLFDASTASLSLALEQFFRGRHAVLILDGCEAHLDACRELAGLLLRASGSLRILATSQHVLNLEGEEQYRLEPLSLPTEVPATVAELESYPGTELFLQRARSRQARFREGDARLVLEICRRLCGLPLAIELAAAWLPTISVVELERRLARQFLETLTGEAAASPTHRSLHAALETSWQLLSPDEQQALRFAALFPGGMNQTAAANLPSSPRDPGVDRAVREDDPLRLVRALVEKSLLRIQEDPDGTRRFTMLGTVRVFCEQVPPHGGEDLIRCFVDHYRQLCAELRKSEGRQGERVALGQLDLERDNLRAALEKADAEAGLELAVNSRYYWLVRELREEYAGIVERALQHPQVKPWNSLAYFEAAAAQVRAFWHRWPRQFRLEPLLANGCLGDTDLLRGLTSAVERARATGSKRIWVDYLLLAGYTAFRLERYEEARAFQRSALAVSREHGIGPLSGPLYELAETERESGNLDEAHRLYAECASEAKLEEVTLLGALAALKMGVIEMGGGEEELGLSRIHRARLLLMQQATPEYWLDDIAAAYMALGRIGEADACLRQALESLLRHNPAPLCRTSLPFYLTELAIAQGETRAAEVLFAAGDTAHPNATHLRLYEPLRKRLAQVLGGRWSLHLSPERARDGLERLGHLLVNERELPLASAVDQAFFGS